MQVFLRKKRIFEDIYLMITEKAIPYWVKTTIIKRYTI